jgi:hypothetical protein
LATGILQESCRVGNLRFDLKPKQFFLNGEVVADTVDCDPV